MNDRKVNLNLTVDARTIAGTRQEKPLGKGTTQPDQCQFDSYLRKAKSNVGPEGTTKRSQRADEDEAEAGSELKPGLPASEGAPSADEASGTLVQGLTLVLPVETRDAQAPAPADGQTASTRSVDVDQMSNARLPISGAPWPEQLVPSARMGERTGEAVRGYPQQTTSQTPSTGDGIAFIPLPKAVDASSAETGIVERAVPWSVGNGETEVPDVVQPVSRSPIGSATLGLRVPLPVETGGPIAEGGVAAVPFHSSTIGKTAFVELSAQSQMPSAQANPSSSGVEPVARVPVRLGSIHRPLRGAGLDPLLQATKPSLDLAISLPEPLTEKLDLSDSAEMMMPLAGPTGADADEPKEAKRVQLPTGERFVLGDLVGHQSLPNQVHPAAEVPVSSALPRQLETLLMQAKNLSLSNGETTEMQMTLEPKELGKLAMHISMENGLVTARFGAESHMVKQLIEAELPRLRDSLEQQGIRLDQVSVQVGGGQAQGFAGRQMRDQQVRWPQRQRRDQPNIAAVLASSSQGMVSQRVKLGYSFDYTV